MDDGSCQWVCQMPPSAPPVESRADEIKEFARGFFGHCDKNGDAHLTMKELKTCLKNIMTQTRKDMKRSIDHQKEQMQE